MSGAAYGVCQCGCGLLTKISPATYTKYGYVRGVPRRFVAGHHSRMRGLKRGYYRMRGRGPGAKLEHVAIAEAALGKPLPPRADVHHADGDSRNNSRGNLVICENRAYHCLLHVRMRVRAAGGNPNTDKVCNKCRRALPLDSFHRLKSNASTGRHAFCRECTAACAKARKERAA